MGLLRRDPIRTKLHLEDDWNLRLTEQHRAYLFDASNPDDRGHWIARLTRDELHQWQREIKRALKAQRDRLVE